MNSYLVFRLYGPMAAWGEIAIGETRRSASYPGKSAILGLLSAALGIKRNEQQRLDALTCGYEIAVKVKSSGSYLKDYHTVQVSAGKAIYYTRRDEIVSGGRNGHLNTILSSREYRCDALAIVAVRAKTTAPNTLEELQCALQKPKFVLYLGRKSCPVSVPLFPKIVSVAGLRMAFDTYSVPPLLTSRDGKRDLTDQYIESNLVSYYWEGDAGDMQPQQTLERYNIPANRERWQFAPSQVHSLIEERK